MKTKNHPIYIKHWSLFFELWSFLWSQTPIFNEFFTITRKMKIREFFNYFFHSASSMKTGSNLREGEGLLVVDWEKANCFFIRFRTLHIFQESGITNYGWGGGSAYLYSWDRAKSFSEQSASFLWIGTLLNYFIFGR